MKYLAILAFLAVVAFAYAKQTPPRWGTECERSGAVIEYQELKGHSAVSGGNESTGCDVYHHNGATIYRFGAQIRKADGSTYACAVVQVVKNADGSWAVQQEICTSSPW